MARNGRKLAIYHFVNSQVQKNIFAFSVITIEPIEVQTRSAPQNDRLNLSLLKGITVVFKKWSEMVEKQQKGRAGGGSFHTRLSLF